MSHNIIRPGDLVAVVRWPCCGKGPIGLVFTVDQIATDPAACCHYCGKLVVETVFAHSAVIRQTRRGAPIAWLQKINPPAIPQHVERREELPA